MRIQTKRLDLKPFSDDDRAALLDLLTNETVTATFMVPDLNTAELRQQMFETLKTLSQSEGQLVAGIYQNGRLIGLINEMERDGGRIELGCAIHPDYHNCGYGAEALQGAIKELFQRGVDQVLAGAFEDNAASIAIMKKCGMTPIDRQECVEYRGQVHRCVYYAIRK